VLPGVLDLVPDLAQDERLRAEIERQRRS